MAETKGRMRSQIGFPEGDEPHHWRTWQAEPL